MKMNEMKLLLLCVTITYYVFHTYVIYYYNAKTLCLYGYNTINIHN